MNRRRSKSRAGFPRNLYESKGYYSWRNPLTGDTFGIGTNRAQAFEEALEANLRISKQLMRPRLIDRITGDRKRGVVAWEEKYRGIVEKRGLTKETKSNYLAFSRRVVKMLGDKPMRNVTALEIADGLEAVAEIERLPRTAQALRAYMRQSFESAAAAGWIDANPVRANIIGGDKSAKRSRLSLDVFMRVYKDAGTWLQNAMALALVSAQRREDVATAQFKDFKEGGWWLTQASEKTDHAHRIFIPNEIKPQGFDLSLGEVVTRCRRAGVLSRYLVHQTETRRGRSTVGSRISLGTVTKAFTEGVEALGIDFSPNTPPTFHEIRSLSLRLYGDQGVNAQLLAGHSDPDTTAIYLNSRGQDYARVTV